MKRVLLIAAVLALGFLGVRWIVRAMASDETRIRWTIERMEDGFNAGRAKAATSGLAPDWSHEGSDELDAELLRAILLREFMDLRQRDRDLTVRVEVPEDTLAIEVDGDRAKVRCEAVFSRRRDDAWTPAWRLRIEGDLARGEDGWAFHKTRHEDLEGKW